MASSVLVLSFVDLNYGIYFVCVASVAFALVEILLFSQLLLVISSV